MMFSISMHISVVPKSMNHTNGLETARNATIVGINCDESTVVDFW
jgi:hypothetical protein